MIAPLLAALALAPVPDSASVGPSASGDATESDASGEKWIHRHPPRRMTLELGLYGGAFFPSSNIELFEAHRLLREMGFKEYDRVAPEVGLRAALYPVRFLGLEAEGGVMPTSTKTDQKALLYHARGHLLLQLARWSVAPFILAGASGLGVESQLVAVGDDIDLGFHFGGGLKFFLTRSTLLRLDVRDTLTAKRGLGASVTHSPEVLLGFSIVLGRKSAQAEPKDTDGDGFLDPDDRCRTVPGVAPDGCPIRDTDGDGFLDPDDRCPEEVGVAPDGCPIRDTDGDGFFDDVDQCPEVPGVEPDGCPLRDTDGDGILDDVDQCVEHPETFNGFEDADGCPDATPAEPDAFTGVIEGIQFDTNKAVIRRSSRPKLDAAVELLKKFPEVRVEISGHTDSKGNRAHNMELSERRAEAVRDYLVAAGIDSSRLQTRGGGPDEPRDSNQTAEGRFNNRRIEFTRLD